MKLISYKAWITWKCPNSSIVWNYFCCRSICSYSIFKCTSPIFIKSGRDIRWTYGICNTTTFINSSILTVTGPSARPTTYWSAISRRATSQTESRNSRTITISDNRNWRDRSICPRSTTDLHNIDIPISFSRIHRITITQRSETPGHSESRARIISTTGSLHHSHQECSVPIGTDSISVHSRGSTTFIISISPRTDIDLSNITLDAIVWVTSELMSRKYSIIHFIHHEHLL